MDLQQLKAFFILGKVKSFTKTAEQLYVTQSAVSHAIKKLEDSLNVCLIDRKSKGLVLSGAGKVLFRSCEKIFYELEKSEQDILALTKRKKLTIQVGSTVEFGTTILTGHVKDFLDEYPDIHLDFVFSHNLIELLLKDEVDLIIDCISHFQPSLEKIHLFREQYTTIGAPWFIQANRLESLDDLGRVRILSIDKDLDWWRNFITAIPSGKRGCLKNVMQINHIRGLINGAISGLGIAFVPTYSVMVELANKTLEDPFPQITPAADEFSVYIKKERLTFKKNQLFVDYLSQLAPLKNLFAPNFERLVLDTPDTVGSTEG